MKLFLDSANIDEIRRAAQSGLIDGITTNPSLLAKEKGMTLEDCIREICTIVDGPVSAEVTTLDSVESIQHEAEKISSWHKNVVVKIPCTVPGLGAVRRLSKKKIRTNVTLVFSVNQVLLAAKVGATMISPFVGRLDDAGESGMEMIARSLEVIRNYKFASEILVASVRSPLHVVAAARLGAHIATVPFKIFEQLATHPLTNAGITKFEEDLKKSIQ